MEKIIKLVFNAEDLTNVEKMFPTLQKCLEGENKKGNLYNIDISEYCIDINTIITVCEKKELTIKSHDIQSSYKVNALPLNNTQFVHLELVNNGDALFPKEYTNQKIGIRYGFFDGDGELIGEWNEKQLNCILLSGEKTKLTIPWTNAPRRMGAYNLKMWFFQEDEMIGNSILEKEIVFE